MRSRRLARAAGWTAGATARAPRLAPAAAPALRVAAPVLAATLAVALALQTAVPPDAFAAQPAPRKVPKAAAAGIVAALPAGDAAAGRVKAESERCLECHGTPGVGQGNSAGEDGKFARLGGQQHAYIVKQVQDFRAGRRTSDFMTMMANSIGDDDLADIAAYFAAQPPMPAGAGASGRPDAAPVPAASAAPLAAADGPAMPAGPARAAHASGVREPVALAQTARTGMLYRLGDPARGVPACAACHGASGEGVAGVAPVIGGQGRRYLSQQLQNWRSGVRANGPAMREAAKALTDGEIEALSLYVSEM